MNLKLVKMNKQEKWIDYLIPIINDYKDGSDEPLDGDGVDDLCRIIRAKIDLHEGNLTEEEYEAILDGQDPFAELNAEYAAAHKGDDSEPETYHKEVESQAGIYEYANCSIKWNDNGDEDEVTIACQETVIMSFDDKVFYYARSAKALDCMVGRSGPSDDFTVTAILSKFKLKVDEEGNYEYIYPKA
jgi:hypothetical protein